MNEMKVLRNKCRHSKVEYNFSISSDFSCMNQNHTNSSYILHIIMQFGHTH